MTKPLQGTVDLPGSKSESNRALMIAAYGGFPLEAKNLSEAHDTVLLQALLEQVNSPNTTEPVVVDCEDAGTVARFMMTYLAGKPGTWVLTGTERLCQRPMAPLVDALRQLGAEIDTVALPAVIHGKELGGGAVTLDASQSSQFASSLLMAAPTWKDGLRLRLNGNPVSMPYLEMTVKMMEHFGAHVMRNANEIVVAPQPYRSRLFEVSSDWSAASYWYEMMALDDGGELLLKGLKSDSLQGDSAAVEMFSKLGVKSEFVETGVLISRLPQEKTTHLQPVVFDFKNVPDLFPAIFVTCVVLHINSVFNSISTLYNKESDRINSLFIELRKLYTFINIVSDDSIIIKEISLTGNWYNNKNVFFNTYHDHRIAMALASLGRKFKNVTVDNHDVVNKSYPGFWRQFLNFI